MIQILNQAEVMRGFDTIGVYIRTHHNLLPDQLTREDWRECQSKLIREGWKEVSLAAGWI